MEEDTQPVGLGPIATIDKLRELNVGKQISLPQLVAVGDKSSEKILVLESITGFSFPRDTRLYDRCATQITCRPALKQRILISIIPRPNADDQVKKKLLDFKHELAVKNDEDVAKIFEKATVAMGIRKIESDSTGDVYLGISQDILKIEICGPEQETLTVINVPEFPRTVTPDFATKTDIIRIKDMIKSYMDDQRAMILAIIPSTIDMPAQKVLELAGTADPSGVRTMAVFTKPDLATWDLKKEIHHVMLGRGRNFKLGSHILQNRSHAGSSVDEQDSFKGITCLPKEVYGIASLKARLRALVVKRSKQEMPHVKADIEKLLHACKGDLNDKGPARGDEQSQRLYLMKLAFKFQNVTEAALNGYYTGDELFWDNSDLKLATKMMKLNEDFSNILEARGHTFSFGLKSPSDDDEGLVGFNENDGFSWGMVKFRYPELSDILEAEDYVCDAASEDSLMELITDVFASNRGPELGTFGGNVLPTAFRRQTVKWEPIVLSHTSRAIVLVDDYFTNLLHHLCPEQQVRKQLWKTHLIDKLCAPYRRAMEHARFLLRIERGGRPSTFNQFFNANVQRQRSERMAKALEEKAEGHDSKRVCLDDIRSQAQKKKNADQVCEDIHDTLVSYYQISRKRFVDAVCQQVVTHFLLEGEESPLKILGPDFVMGLDADQLESIADEEPESKRQRKSLEQEKEKWEAALKVVRNCT